MRAAFPGISDDEAEDLAAMLHREEQGREAVAFWSTPESRCVARFGRLCHERLDQTEVAFVERIET